MLQSTIGAYGGEMESELPSCSELRFLPPTNVSATLGVPQVRHPLHKLHLFFRHNVPSAGAAVPLPTVLDGFPQHPSSWCLVNPILNENEIVRWTSSESSQPDSRRNLTIEDWGLVKKLFRRRSFLIALEVHIFHHISAYPAKYMKTGVLVTTSS